MNLDELKTPDRILDKALQKEKEARDFYAKLANQCHVDFIRDLLERLQNEESKHIRLIQDMRARLETDHDLT